MGLPVTVYRSTDVGAPNHNGSVGTLLNVLKKCLVSGYGDKPGLGWALDFSDEINGKYIYRNNVSDGGSGGVVQFSAESNDLTTTSGKSLITKCASDASGIDALIRASYSLGRPCYNTGLSWQVVGTSRGFYLTLNTTLNSNMKVTDSRQWTIFIGDIISYWANDASTFTLIHGQTNLTSDLITTSANYCIGFSSTLFCSLYDTDGNGVANNYTSVLPQWIYYTSNATYNNFDPELANLQINMTPAVLYNTSPTLIDRDGVYRMRSAITPSIRGQVSGLHISPMGCLDDGTVPSDIEISSVGFTRVRGNQAANLWINTTEWDYV
ncbi:hypothetical protein [Shewanella frigidimarina]|uniref:hypothetical protein n=1 Tax=Shewanella frigidimarina TaxID=56812 RepID=UPI000F50F1E0|nr:hypothetical protein [Shewanella frigidimarina]RPA32610.1 hypothetical protein EGC78_08280 [Shewanella frigidimarina]